MNVGFTGTRRGMTDAQRELLGNVLIFDVRPTLFRHGSCKGADVEAARLARHAFGDAVRILAYPGPDDDPCREDSGVDDEVLPGKTHFARNRNIVNLSDVLLAAPAGMTEQDRGGTWYTVRYARKAGKRVVIIWPDGCVQDERDPCTK